LHACVARIQDLLEDYEITEAQEKDLNDALLALQSVIADLAAKSTLLFVILHAFRRFVSFRLVFANVFFSLCL
jgi:hypothetical protein